MGIPAVVIGHKRTEVPNLVNVITDSSAIGKIGAEHLLHCGFKHFAYCGYGGPGSSNAEQVLSTWSNLRGEAFERQIRKAGFEVNPYTIPSTSTTTWRQESAKTADWLRSLPKPVGLLACNDDCGRQVIEACKLANLAVPDEVGVLGADNDEVVCGLSEPPLSSVAINFERAGYEAALELFRLLQGKRSAPRKINVPATHVVARRSTDVMAVADPHVTKALQFIRDHAREHVMISKVAAAAALSRRALEIKFRREMSCSIHEHIRRVRTDQIVRWLVETDLPVGQIAENLGFADVQHFARYFCASKQMSPLAYRRIFGRRIA